MFARPDLEDPPEIPAFFSVVIGQMCQEAFIQFTLLFFPSAPLCLIKFFKVFNVPHSLHFHSSEDSKIIKCYGGSLVKNNLT